MLKNIEATAPPRVDPEKLRDGHHLTIAAESPLGPALAHFDPSTGSAAIYYLGTGIWHLVGPVAFGEFTASLAARGIVVADGDDLNRWLLACAPAVSDAGPMH